MGYLPDDQQHIKESAFSGCTGLKGFVMISDSTYSVGASAFSGCAGLKEAHFGEKLQSIGQSAFKGCEGLEEAIFKGDLAARDYYGSEEEKPSFPETCQIIFRLRFYSAQEDWRGENPTGETSEGSGAGSGPASGGEAKEMPYLWTSGLEDREFVGGGIYANVSLSFDAGLLNVRVNGRDCGTVSYSADPNNYEDRVVSTQGFYCRDGWIRDLRFEDGYGRDAQLFAELVCDDGEARRVVFHTGSEECLYIVVEDDLPVVRIPEA